MNRLPAARVVSQLISPVRRVLRDCQPDAYLSARVMVLDTILCYGIACHMAARMLFHHKEIRGDVIIEMVIWQLPDVTALRPHGLKYRFYCGTADACLVRYDVESGKGDHRHYGEREEVYDFQSIERQVEDFRNDCIRQAGWEW